jgi:4-amino-4-deoxy-L-arabinose transferase-like glycosyltransferase
LYDRPVAGPPLRGFAARLAERPATLLALGAIAAVAAFQLWITPSNPPGFHRDEASIAYNAYTISTSLRDEDGGRLPLFFRSFEDYKSPLYPYLLAAVFRVTGPHKEVARGLSALLVLASVLLLGVLAQSVTGSGLVAVVTVVLAGLTPWLFEIGRVALEVSTQPLLLVLLLLLLLRSWRRSSWGVLGGVPLGCVLGLLTYSYTGSRLLGPLLAAALVVFAGRGRWRWLAGAWGTFALLLVPLGIYALRHPGALTSRYEATTIVEPGMSSPRVVLQAISNYVHDSNLWHWATSGDPAPYIHVYGYGSLFASVVLLALAGAVLVLMRRRGDLWWRYVLVATLLVPIPAALTVDRFNAIRLAALPVFVLVLAVPALDALLASARRGWGARAAVAALALLVAFQFGQFLHEYRYRGPGRTVLFDAGVDPLLRLGFDGGRKLYIDYDDRGAQAQALWHATEDALPRDRVVILPDGGIPPPGSIVFARFQECDYVCRRFASWEGYWLARAIGPKPVSSG